MKHIIYVLAGAALLTASCTAYEDSLQPDQASVPVIATIGTETRTQIGDKGGNAYKVVWNSGDRIIISTGTSSKDKAIYTTSAEGSAAASFYPEENSNAIDFSKGAIAGYPVENMYLGAPDADKEIYFSIPEVQSYIPDSFDQGAMPMVSDVTDKAQLKFFNAAGVIRLALTTKLADIKVSSITITTSSTISGECGYIPKSRKVFFDDSMLSSSEVTLECGEGVDISQEAKAFHIVVPHQTYTDMYIRVTTADDLQQTFSLKPGKEIAIGRSSISTLPLEIKALTPIGKPKITASVKSVTFESIRIEVNMENVSAYYCGFQTKLSYLNDLESGYILESLPYKTPYTTPLSYSGSVTSFQTDFSDILIEPGQSYVLWFVPQKSGGSYTKEDIVYVETMTKAYTAGGTKEVYYSNLKTDKTSISVQLSSPGAGHIYCQLLSTEQISRYSSEDELIRLLLEPGGKSTVFDKDSDLFERKFLKPGANMTLIALAIDRAGKYGPLFMEEFYTQPIPYNSIKVSIDKDPESLHKSSVITWTADSDDVTEYRYILRDTENHLWKNTLEASVQTAQEKMYLDPGLYYITHTETPQADVSGLTSGKEYIIIVVAADSEGNISLADSWTFTY